MTRISWPSVPELILASQEEFQCKLEAITLHGQESAEISRIMLRVRRRPSLSCCLPGWETSEKMQPTIKHTLDVTEKRIAHHDLEFCHVCAQPHDATYQGVGVAGIASVAELSFAH